MEPEGLASAAQALDELRDDPWFPYPDAVDLLMAFGKAGVPDLIAALDDPTPRIRSVAARALGTSHSEEAAIALARALRDPEPEVQRSAAAAITDNPDPRWIGPLGELLLGDDQTVQLTAAGVLGELGAPAVPALAEALDKYMGNDPWVPGEIVAALSQTGAPAASAPLIRALAHPQAHVRQAAIEALTQMSPSGPITSALRRVATDENEDPYLRRLAAG